MIIWAPSSEFVSSSIPSWQILTAHAQPFRGARDLAFCLKVPLDSLLVWASSEGSGETARMRKLAWTFAARIGDKYQIRLTGSILLIPMQFVLCFNNVFFFKKLIQDIASVKLLYTSMEPSLVLSINTKLLLLFIENWILFLFILTGLLCLQWNTVGCYF